MARSEAGVRRALVGALCAAVALGRPARCAAQDAPPAWVLLDSGRPGPAVAVVGGLHGDEPSGAEAARALVGRGAPARGSLAVLAEANPAALAAGTRAAPGGSDMNRLFGERRLGQDGGPEARRAAAILEAALGADLVLDLHEEGGAWGEADLPTLVLSPAAAGLALDLVEALRDSGMPFAFAGGAPAGSLAGELGRLGRRALVVEVPARLSGQDRVRMQLAVVEAALRLLGMR